jgi:hypothetical protein
LLDSGAFNPGLTRPPEVVCAIDPHAGAETPESSKPKPPSGSEPQATLDSQSSVSAAVGGEQPSDPELRAAFMRAHRAWSQRFQPWLLMDEEWLNA